MNNAPKGKKMHVTPDNVSSTTLDGVELVTPLCARPTPADMTIPEYVLKFWIENGQSTKLFCTTCLKRTTLHEAGNQEEDSRAKQPTLQAQ